MSKAAAIVGAVLAAIAGVTAWIMAIFAKGEKSQQMRQNAAAAAVNAQLAKLDATADEQARREIETIKNAAEKKQAEPKTAENANNMIEEAAKWEQ